ncbi:MAG: hypothetical protein CVU63_01375 [Deltaproteobacteria bacterium HGW-Deltaproteobacteria-20]|nr:MAG: hypothetical protein CVU63_01375 [Deltaproteobacteria bacterium HGW-Deltaproteobacteria-20]
MRTGPSLAVLAALLLLGCTPTSKPAGASSHADPPPHAVDPPGCRASERVLSPLLVGADEAFHASLQRASAQGVVVVAYGCDGLRVLEGCRAPGSYAFAATTRVDHAARVTQDETWNLPLSREAVALSGEQVLDVATARLGLLSTTTDAVHGDELRGDCASSTHFVRSVSLGVAATRRGAVGSAVSAENVLGATVPEGCGEGADRRCAPTQLHLQPIAAHRAPADWSSVQPATVSPCPDGTAWTGLVCAKGQGEPSRGPEANEVSSLDRSCEEGVASACAALGRGDGGRPRLGRACWLGDADACASYAEVALLGETPSGDGYEAWRRACEGGLAHRCWSWGMAAARGGAPYQELSAYEAWVRGCQRGSRESCHEAAALAKKEARAAEVLPLLTASCAQSDPSWQGCMALGEAFLTGDGVERSTLRAVDLFERVCAMKVRAGCVRAARVAGERDRTFLLLGKACTLGELDACMQAAELGGISGEGRRWLVEACERFRHAPACERIKG